MISLKLYVNLAVFRDKARTITDREFCTGVDIRIMHCIGNGIYRPLFRYSPHITLLKDFRYFEGFCSNFQENQLQFYISGSQRVG